MIVVSDTSPLNYLVLIRHEDVLPTLFGRVIAPRAVLTELAHPDSPTVVRTWANAPPSWLEVRSPSRIDPQIRLGPGESEALSLAKELNADAVLIDERRGFLTAQQLGLFATGTLGVLEVAAEKGLIPLAPAIDALRQTSFRASERLLRELLERDEGRA